MTEGPDNGDKTRLFLVGLPRTGKSTYLAAFWNAVEHRGGPDRLRCPEPPRLLGYLNTLRDAWLSGEQVGRTSRNAAEVIELDLIDRSDFAFRLSVPDLNGEVFSDLWTEREGPAEVVEALGSADGLLLFLHPEHLHRAETIRSYAMARLDAGLEGEDLDGRAPHAEDQPDLPYDPRTVDTQVQLVAILQDVDAERLAAGREVAPVAVIVSAWDVVKEFGRKETPDAFLERHLPLLLQYLQARADQRPVRIYGVSAQGGDYEQLGAELAEADPATRVQVELGTSEEGGGQHDITAPVRWLLTVITRRLDTTSLGL